MLVVLALAMASLAGSSFARPAPVEPRVRSGPEVEEDLVVGVPVEGVLAADDPVLPGFGPHRAHVLRAAHDGTLTLTLESYDFDACLVLCADDGIVLQSSDGGGVMMHERLVARVEGGRSYEVVATTLGGRVGRYHLEAAEGEVPPPTGRQEGRLVARTYAAWGRWEDEAAATEPDRATEHRANACDWMTNAGKVWLQLGDPNAAHAVLLDAIDEARQLGDGGREVLARAVLGEAQVGLGRFDDALAGMAPLLDVARGSELEPYLLQHLGQSLSGLGRHEEARARFEELLAAADAGGPVTTVLIARLALAGECEALRDFQATREHHARAVEAARATGQPALLFRALFDSGTFEERRGRFADARIRFDEALSNAFELDARVASLGHLANVDINTGHFGRAREAYAGALALAEDAGNEAYVLDARSGLALVELGVGHFAEAAQEFSRLLERFADSDDRSGRCRLWLNLALTRDEMGDAGSAQSAIERALVEARAADDLELEARTLFNAQRLHLRKHRFDAARRAGEAALAIAREETLLDLEAGSLSNRAEQQLLEGDPSAALESARAAIGIYDRMADDPEALNAWENLALASLALGRVDDAGRALALARERIDDFRPHDLGIQEVAELRSRYAGWNRVVQDWTAARLSTAADDQVDAIVAEGFIEAGRWKGRALLEGLAARAREGGAFAAEGAGFEALRERVLGPGDLVIDYEAGAQRLYAYVVTATEARMLDLGERTTLQSRADAYVEQLSWPSEGADVDALVTLGHELYQRLLAPALATVEQPVTRLVVIPDPSLATLPVEALVIEPGADCGSTVFVIDRHPVIYVPSAPVLLALDEREPRRRTGRILAVADPVYPSEMRVGAGSAPGAATTSGATPDLPRLPGTRAEALALLAVTGEPPGGDVVGRVEHERDVEVATERMDLFLGRAATAAPMRGALGDYAIVHLAAHGVVDAGDPRRSGLYLSAGAGDDGFLSMAEVLDLHLDADVAVLSACRTARGRVRRGDGVQSLASAFLFAGARSVVASLWQVSDIETTVTMRRFYDGLLARGEEPTEALRQAKLALRRGRAGAARSGRMIVPRGTSLREPPPGAADGTQAPAAAPAGVDTAHPYYWAPFISIGAPR